MKIKSYTGSYEVKFSSDFSFAEEVAKEKNKFFIIDHIVFETYQNKLTPMIGNSPYYLIDAIEKNKNIQEVLIIMDELVELPTKRNTTLIAIGGGIVQDVSAFISNIIYRGISWILIPTTLLAQTDSCIGSKSSLNYKKYKNLLGYFYPPRKIYINSAFLSSLEEKDYLSGLGEIMKCALMAGYDSYTATKANLEALKGRKADILLKEITKALNFKKAVIEKDEFDRDYRNIMNFGHTFGHALETTSGYNIPHGQAVSFGMMIANEISFIRGYIDSTMKEEINSSLHEIVNMRLLKKEYLCMEEYLETLKNDKKYIGINHTCILFDGNGVKKFNDIKDDEIIKAIDNVFWF